MTTLRVLLVAALASVGCADDAGTPPQIANLTASPSTAPVGTTTTVSGTLTFTDRDGDLASLAVTVTLPDGAAQELPPTPLQNVASRTEGSVAWAVLLTPPSAGRYDLAIALLDDADNASNVLTTSITAP